MPGTLVQDSLAPNLLSGATLNSAGSTNGTAAFVNYPGEISFVLKTSTVTGTSATLDVVIQASNDSTFASGVVTLGQFELSGSNASQTSVTKRIYSRCDHKYLRAAVTLGGTSPVYTSSTLYVRQPYDRYTRTSTA